MLAVLRESAVKPAIEPKLFGTRISRTSWPALNSENSSWFFMSSAKIVTRSASTRSTISSLQVDQDRLDARGGVDLVRDLDQALAVGELALGRVGQGSLASRGGPTGPPADPRIAHFAGLFA